MVSSVDARICVILVLVGALKHSYIVVITVDCVRGKCVITLNQTEETHSMRMINISPYLLNLDVIFTIHNLINYT